MGILCVCVHVHACLHAYPSVCEHMCVPVEIIGELLMEISNIIFKLHKKIFKSMTGIQTLELRQLLAVN